MTEVIDATAESKRDGSAAIRAGSGRAQARSEGVELIGPGGSLTGLIQSMPKTALAAEISEHLGYEQVRRSGPERRELPRAAPGPDGVHFRSGR